MSAYRTARAGAALIFRLTLRLPANEKFEAVSQSRCSSRSVCANLVEAWRKRKYPAAFRSKLSDAEAEAAETQVWLDIMLDCGYITKDEHAEVDDIYDKIIAQLVNMAKEAQKFGRLPY